MRVKSGKETEQSMVCARRLRKVVLTIEGTVILWTREKRGHWRKSSARKNTEELHVSFPALPILVACWKKSCCTQSYLWWTGNFCAALLSSVFSKKPQPRLHGALWWIYLYRIFPVVGVQQTNKKEWLKDESRYRDEICCLCLYRLARLMDKLGMGELPT